MKKLLIASLLLASTNTLASAITLFDSFGTQGSTNDVAIASLNQTISLDASDILNDNQGTLTDIVVTIISQIDSEGRSRNVSIENGRAQATIDLTEDLQVSSNLFSNSIVLLSEDADEPILTSQSSEENVFTLLGTNESEGRADTQFDYRISTNELRQEFTLTDLSALSSITDNIFNFNFTTIATTRIDNDVASGTGEFVNSFQTGAFGSVELSFTFDDVEVSEPTTLAIFALGLLGLASRRYKK